MPGGQSGPVTETPQTMAPMDVTGYWVTAITEDWRVRMITPQRGEFLGLPLNETGIELANAWDPDRDIANGDECRAFGAAAIMRSPTRLHITWEDDKTDFGLNSTTGNRTAWCTLIGQCPRVSVRGKATRLASGSTRQFQLERITRPAYRT